jgi:hypothetical protein
LNSGSRKVRKCMYVYFHFNKLFNVTFTIPINFFILHLSLFLTPGVMRQNYLPGQCCSSKRLRNTGLCPTPQAHLGELPTALDGFQGSCRGCFTPSKDWIVAWVGPTADLDTVKNSILVV